MQKLTTKPHQNKTQLKDTEKENLKIQAKKPSCPRKPTVKETSLIDSNTITQRRSSRLLKPSEKKKKLLI